MIAASFKQEIEELYALFPEYLPSRLRVSASREAFEKSERFFEGISSYQFRKNYIKHMGFPLLTSEFKQELEEVLKQENIHSFIELYAGYGTLTLLLNEIGSKGKGYTLEPNGHNWGLDADNKWYKVAREKQLLEHRDIAELKLVSKPDMMVASWIPYEGGQELMTFAENNAKHLPEYFLLIGEGEGGCTWCNEGFKWLHLNFMEVHHFQDFISFDAIYDNAILYKRKLHE